MIWRYQLPEFIERGVATTLTFDVYSDAGAQQTATDADITVYAGSRKIVDAVNADALGPPATYALTTSATEPLASNWLIEAKLTIGGEVHTFKRPAYHVLRAPNPTITDTDLTDLHPDLTDLASSFQAQRVAAWNLLQRRLIRQGNRPQLILDEDALSMAHVYKTLEIIFRSGEASVGDQRYADLEAKYRQLFEDEMSSIVFTYDHDQDGTVDGAERRSANPTIWLSRPNPHWAQR